MSNYYLRFYGLKGGQLLLALIIVGFGQPAWNLSLSFLASILGYAILWQVTTYLPPKMRFLVAWGGYTCIQALQLSWLLSHPYFYIYFVYAGLSIILGALFGLCTLLIEPSRLKKLLPTLGIAALFTILEWIRLLPLSGLSFNPSGLTLTWNHIPMQLASIVGIFGLSFWVMLTNLFALKAWINGLHFKPLFSFGLMVIFPYVFGWVHILYQESKFKEERPFSALLINTAFPAEEQLGLHEFQEYIDYAFDEWGWLLNALKEERGEPLDLLVLPEGFVPFGAQYAMYEYPLVKQTFSQIFGRSAAETLPHLHEPLAQQVYTTHRNGWMVTNSYWVLALMHQMQSDILIGLEGGGQVNGKKVAYNSALFFKPQNQERFQTYSKRVLLPMAEYIPFLWCKSLAAKYGVSDSFCHGEKAQIFTTTSGIPFGVSICYEETFGNMMRENKQLGAKLLVNITSDVWYPNSRLSWQHFDLARLRTVEMGIPLIRSCNYGVTAAIDSLGRILAKTGGDGHIVEKSVQPLKVDVPIHTYPTLYTFWGDSFILSLCCFFLFGLIIPYRKK